MQSRYLTTAAVLAALATGAFAQQARTPVRVMNGAPVAPDAATEPTVTLTVKGPDAKQFLTVTANKADARDLLRQMGTKSANTVLVSPSVAGKVTINLAEQPIDDAIAAVAKSAHSRVRKIIVPENTAANLSTDVAGRLADALAAMPARAIVTDPTSGKTLTLATTTPAPAAGQAVVYYIQGPRSYDQEQADRAQREIARATAANGNADPVTQAVQSIGRLPLQQRFQAMQDMRRQMFQNMTPQEQQQMRDMFRQNGGGRGGWRGRGRN